MCPKCKSMRLKIKPASGLERMLVLFTNKRKYRCLHCGLAFRAPDRRSVSREIGAAYSAARAAGILR